MATAPDAKPAVDYPTSPVPESNRPDDAVPITQEISPLTVEEIVGAGQVPVTPETKKNKKKDAPPGAPKKVKVSEYVHDANSGARMGIIPISKNVSVLLHANVLDYMHRRIKFAARYEEAHMQIFIRLPSGEFCMDDVLIESDNVPKQH